MASHFTANDAAPRVVHLDAVLRDLVYEDRAVMKALFRRHDDDMERHIVVVSGELIALESGSVWLAAQQWRRRRNATLAALVGCVTTMLDRTGTNVYRLPVHAARMCGFEAAAELQDAAAGDNTSVIMVREYVYNVRTRARMHVIEKMEA